MFAWVKMDRLRLDFPKPHLRPREVRHDRDALPRRARRFADATHDFRMTRKVAVREIEPRDVHTGTDEPHEHLGRFRRRSDGRNDLRLVIGEGFAHDANMVLPLPRRSLTACFTRSDIETSAS